MADSTDLEKRIDSIIASWGLDLPKKRMFSGVGYFLNGNLFCSTHKDELVIRVDEGVGKELLQRPGFRPFQMGNRQAMKTWYFAGNAAISNDTKLEGLLQECRNFVMTLPAKRG